MTILMIGSGLLGTILGIRASLERFPTTVIGLVMSCYYLGFLAGCVVAARALPRFGHLRLFGILALLWSLAAVAYPLLPVAGAWSLIRALTGFATAGLYVVAESWLAAASHPGTRGRLLAVYLLVVNAGYGIGQVLLAVGSPQGLRLFLVAALVVGLSALPLLAVRSTSPPLLSHGHLSWRALVGRAPLGPATSFVTGVGVGAILGIGAAYATEVGMSVPRVGLFMAAAMAGGIALQWPIGFLSDRINRRQVIVFAALLASASALAAIPADPLSGWPFLAMFCFTAFSFPLYSLAISHVNDALSPERVVPAAAILLAVYGVGTLLGPLATSVAMDRIGPGGFWLVAGACHLLLALYGSYRVVKRRRLGEVHHLPPLPMSLSPQTGLLIEDPVESPGAAG
jgi:MFS family permease